MGSRQDIHPSLIVKKGYLTSLRLALLSTALITSLSALFSIAQAQSDSSTAAAASVPAPSAIIARDVLVATGDTLRSIAQRELGRAGFAPQLAEFNGLIVAAPLVPGNIIRVPIHVPARGEFAEVVFVKGDVFAFRQSTQASAQPASASSADQGIEQIVLQRNSEIISGDTVSTGDGSYVSIEFSSGSVVNLQPDTEAVLSRLNCLPTDDSCVIEIRTLKGKVTSDVEVRDQQPVNFRISSPYASAVVRGTVFDFDTLADKVVLGVTEGRVDVSAVSQTVALETGFGSVVVEDQPPSEPIPLLPAPVFKRVPSRVAPGDTVAWWPFSDAVQYDARVSSDEAGNQTLASYGVSNDEVGVDAVEPGDYYLQVRAIDANGLQGFTSNTQITVASIDDSIVPVDTVVTRQGNEFLVVVQNPPDDAPGYEIQISDNEAFEDPLSVDVNTNGSAVFRLPNDRVFARARVLLDPFTVSAYGEISSSSE